MFDKIFSLVSNLPSLVVVALTLTFVLLLKNWLQRPVNIPPTPTFAFPILGHIPLIGKQPIKKMKEWRDSTGDIYSIFLAHKLYIVISSYELLREVFVKQADHSTHRPPSLFREGLPDGKKGILGASGPHWKEQRSVSMAILRTFGMGKNRLAEKISEEVDMYLNGLDELKGKATDIRLFTNLSVSNVICAILLGKRFDFKDKAFMEIIHLLDEQVTRTGVSSILNIYPWVRHLPGDFFKAKRTLDIAHQMDLLFTSNFVAKFRDTYEESETDNFIIAYFKEMKKKQNAGEYTELNERSLRRVIANLFAAGTETTSTTILWFLLYMLHYPEVQAKVYKEILDVAGPERAVNMHDKPKLNFFNATVMETQRLGSIVPLSLPHHCTEDIHVAGYTIPKDAVLIPNLDAVLKDEKIWPEPLVFKPERFLDSNGSLKMPEEFIPFSLGRRVCLGEALAKMELFLFMSNLIQRFEVLPEDPENLPPLEGINGVTFAPYTYKVILKRRA